MNFKELKIVLSNLGVTVTPLSRYKMRFIGNGFIGECELLGNNEEYTKLVRMYVNKDYDHDQLVQSQELIMEWQRK